jgi:hypothetical protein
MSSNLFHDLVVMLSLSSHHAVTRQSSGCHWAVSHQEIFKQLSGSCQTDVKWRKDFSVLFVNGSKSLKKMPFKTPSHLEKNRMIDMRHGVQ